MKQHKEGLRKPDTSRAADHMIQNNHHVINFDQPEITYDAKVIAEMSKPSSLVWYMLET